MTSAEKYQADQDTRAMYIREVDKLILCVTARPATKYQDIRERKAHLACLGDARRILNAIMFRSLRELDAGSLNEVMIYRLRKE